jgi:hypothetical protein
MFKRRKKLSKISYVQNRIWKIQSSGALYKFRERTIKIISFIAVLSIGMLLTSEKITDSWIQSIVVNLSTEALGISVTLFIVERIWKNWELSYKKDIKKIDRYKKRRMQKYILSRRRKLLT